MVTLLRCDKCDRGIDGEQYCGDCASEYIARIAAFESALAAAREENERLRYEIERIFRETPECIEIKRLSEIVYRQNKYIEALRSATPAMDAGRVERIVSYCQAIADGNACEIGLARAIVDGYGTPDTAAHRPDAGEEE